MSDNTVWFVAGADHDARTVRNETWISHGGQTGVIGPWSCEVAAQGTPNNTVRIMPGGFSVAATSQFAAIGYPSAPMQSYSKVLNDPVTVEIDSTSSSGGRTDVVGIVIDDPEFEGTSPDPETHQYWRPHVAKNVGNNATRPEHFASIPRPFIPLAQVRIPASTATITNSMITDIRFMAVTRTEPKTTFSLQQQDLQVDVGDSWVELHTVDGLLVPQWATHAHYSGSVSGLRVLGSGTMTGQIRGRFNSSSSRSFLTFFQEVGSSQGTRLHLPVSGSVQVSAGERGTVQDFAFYARRTFGSNTTLAADETRTRYDLSVTFTEEPVRR